MVIITLAWSTASWNHHPLGSAIKEHTKLNLIIETYLNLIWKTLFLNWSPVAQITQAKRGYRVPLVTFGPLQNDSLSVFHVCCHVCHNCPVDLDRCCSTTYAGRLPTQYFSTQHHQSWSLTQLWLNQLAGPAKLLCCPVVKCEAIWSAFLWLVSSLSLFFS